jgi:hypothetical protein
MRLFPALAAALFLAAGVVAPTGAAPPDKGAHGKQKQDDAETAPAVTGGIVFTATERQTIRNYFAAGNAERAKPLPPGIAKKVARGGTLPPGIAKRYLPADLDTRLPPCASGTERLILGNDVLLVEISTGAIIDMIKQALR